jgi:hypothetical protein
MVVAYDRASVTRWDEAREHEEEYARLRQATDLVSHAAADLQRAAAAVGDHALAVALRDAVEPVQVLQAQVVTAAEKARARGQRAARQAEQAYLQARVHEAANAVDPFAPGTPDE